MLSAIPPAYKGYTSFIEFGEMAYKIQPGFAFFALRYVLKNMLGQYSQSSVKEPSVNVIMGNILNLANSIKASSPSLCEIDAENKKKMLEYADKKMEIAISVDSCQNEATKNKANLLYCIASIVYKVAIYTWSLTGEEEQECNLKIRAALARSGEISGGNLSPYMREGLLDL